MYNIAFSYFNVSPETFSFFRPTIEVGRLIQKHIPKITIITDTVRGG